MQSIALGIIGPLNPGWRGSLATDALYVEKNGKRVIEHKQ